MGIGRHLRDLTALAALLGMTSCSGAPDEDEWYLYPGDVSAEQARQWAGSKCHRLWQGRWYVQAFNCEPMDPPHIVRGVLVLSFEERSFFEAPPEIPAANDPRRYLNELRIRRDDFRRLPPPPEGGRVSGQAYELVFVGERSHNPVTVDCQGRPGYDYGVDQLLWARYLGAIPVAREGWPGLPIFSGAVTVRVRHGGVLGQLEAKALRECLLLRARYGLHGERLRSDR